MANTSSEVRNYFKIDLLIGRSRVSLRNLFKNRYSLYNNGQVWDDSPTSGSNYLTNVVLKNKKSISLTPVQKTAVSNGDSEQWDISVLTSLLLFIERPKTLTTNEIQQLDQEDKSIQKIREYRNELAHNAKSVHNVEFNQVWNNLAAILIEFGDIDVELDKLKDDSVFDSSTESINEENRNEALRLKSLGVQAHTDGKYSEAIGFFTKATVLPGVSSHDRAMLFSNMAASRLLLHEQQEKFYNISESLDAKDERYLALQDAKQARKLWPTWWKAHVRVGKVHAALDEHEKAINSFERAFALDPTRKEIQEPLDESRITLHRQSRNDYVDPRQNIKSIPEVLKERQEKSGLDAEKLRKYDEFLMEIDPSKADVFKGHQYECGDIGVQQNYEKAAEYFGKAADQGNAEGMYNLAKLRDRGLGVKKDHQIALKLLEQAASQPPKHPLYPQLPNVGVAESEHALGVRYFEGISVRKDPGVALYWYQRASDHGSAMAANNLGTMYLRGYVVERDLDKGMQLIELAAKRGDPVGMESLAGLFLYKNNFQMAKIWHDRACEAGNLEAQNNRDQFAKQIEDKQRSISQSSLNDLMISSSFDYFWRLYKTEYVASTTSEHSYLQDYEMLCEYAKRGSKTAKHLCNALEHFMQALNILLSFDNLSQKEEQTFIHELSQCYRIETIVAQIPCQMQQRVLQLVNRTLCLCTEKSNSDVSQLDEDVRICYIALNFNSYELVNEFLALCKEKYPKSVCFYLMSGALNGFLRRYHVGLYDINKGLEIEPNNYELLYHKAVLLRHLYIDYDEAINAYQTFINIAPNDHRKIPDAYYETAICYILRDTIEAAVPQVRKLYAKGKEAEKSQLPCFLPYQSGNLDYLKPMFDSEFFSNIEPDSENNRKQHLTDSHRVEVITKHRMWEGQALDEKHTLGQIVASTSIGPRVKQQTSKSLIGLKPITLRELDPTKDRVYKGYVLSGTIIDETYSWEPSVHLVIEDENFDCERMLIYNFPKEQGEYLTRKLYTIGSKMHIINPYLRIGTGDMKPSIRVDDVASIVMQSDSERIVNMCRYCCEADASKLCGKCQRARYCSKECQINDWKLYKHKLICKSK
ncbi:unnamed protein product [Adineta ricciae]|uniref:MYND-type domain-containing protein n=2 Tax=Adineta ricciae TaxID=249248 RepID=A0A815KIJ9_ADIRI|nr:unnamed protein product [Adineta ricciae]